MNRKQNCVSPGIIFSAEIRNLQHLATAEITSSTLKEKNLFTANQLKKIHTCFFMVGENVFSKGQAESNLNHG